MRVRIILNGVNIWVCVEVNYILIEFMPSHQSYINVDTTPGTDNRLKRKPSRVYRMRCGLWRQQYRPILKVLGSPCIEIPGECWKLWSSKPST